jgi:hypothetical protein
MILAPLASCKWPSDLGKFVYPEPAGSKRDDETKGKQQGGRATWRGGTLMSMSSMMISGLEIICNHI